MSKIGWCDNCNVPIIDAAKCDLCNSSVRELKLGMGEIKPIFDFEKELYKKILIENGFDPSKLIPEGLCFFNGGELISDGMKVFRLLFDEERNSWRIKLFKKFTENPPKLKGSNLQKTIKANEKILKRKERKCLFFLKKTFEDTDYLDLPKAVSFSGGKDSTVVLNLARKVDNELDVIFLDTTLEFPETLEFVSKITKIWNLNLIKVNPKHDFLKICEKLGPPSIFMKWCCKTQKFTPLNALINKRYQKDIIVVNGLRKAESPARADLQKVQRNKLIPKQLLVFPILEWSSLDTWLYILWKKLPVNEAYRYGFDRVGCWACPERSLRKLKWTEMTHPNLMKRLYKVLNDYAKYNGFDEKWIYTGKWRLRATKFTKTPICFTSRLCSQNNEFTYNIQNSEVMDKINELLKVFGEKHELGLLTKIVNPDIEITIATNCLLVNAKNTEILSLFNRQLTKAMNCVDCGSCIGICQHDALQLKNGKIIINNEKCIHCLKCIKSKNIRMGCVALNYKSHILSIS